MNQIIDAALLREVAASARRFLEPVWLDWRASTDVTPPSSGTCGRSSLLLQRILVEDCGTDAVWRCGNPAHGSYGFNAAAGWQAHAWVRIGEWIADITADQFNAPPVLITSLDDARYAESEDIAFAESKARRRATVEALWPHWLISAERASLRL